VGQLRGQFSGILLVIYLDCQILCDFCGVRPESSLLARQFFPMLVDIQALIAALIDSQIVQRKYGKE
jgi:hypothetical protein